MSERFLSVGWQQVCDNLLAIRRSGEWRRTHASFAIYVQERWSISKSRAKLLCDFASFCRLCREEYAPVPESPDNVKPILALAQKHWLHVWQMCRDYAEGSINAKHCQSIMEQFNFIPKKRLPPQVLNSMRVRKAAKTMAEFGDGEKLADQVGRQGLGKNWKDAVRVTIEADEFVMTENAKPF